MKRGWEIKSLGEIADVEYGFTNKSTEKGDYRYVRITDIDNNGELISTNKKYIKHSKEAGEFLVRDNDLLMARTGATFAKVLLFNGSEPSVFASYLIRIKFKEKIENKFYWYFTKTKSYWDQANSLASGAAQPHFNGAAVKQVMFSYPKSISEQQRIVSILDEAFTAIATAKANAEQNLKNAKELFESYVQGVFENKGEGWEHVRLGDVCQINDGTHYSPKNSDKGEFMYITAKNIKRYYIDFTNLSYVSEKDHKEIYSRCAPKKGDVLYIKDGATAGIATINTIEEEFSMLSSVALLKCSNKILNTFLVHYMNSNVGRKNFLGYIDGAAITRLTLIKIKNVGLLLPPFQEQNKIVRLLDALSAETKRLEDIYQQKLNGLEELKKSILKKAFNGELKTSQPVPA